ncbi:MAG: hypothetical protein WC360_03060 [Opitutales bacterium]|jgi:hypothetical protein
MFTRGLTIFWRALKANWIPAIGIWIAGSFIVYAYYQGGIVKDAANGVMVLRERFGLIYPICSMTLFGALLPALTQALLSPSERAAVLRRLPYVIPFWAYKGIEVEYLYKLQGILWGDEPTLLGVIGKVAVDQFVYNPLLGAITLILYLRWVAIRIGELPAGTPRLPKHWYKLLVVPLLVATWALWIPAVTLVYLLPTPLQLPMSNLILWLWAMMLVFMSKQEA